MTTAHAHRIRHSLLLLAFAGLAFSCIALGGCYKRVVGVEGPGSDAYDVYEPNLKEPVTDPYSNPNSIQTKKYQGK